MSLVQSFINLFRVVDVAPPREDLIIAKAKAEGKWVEIPTSENG